MEKNEQLIGKQTIRTVLFGAVLSLVLSLLVLMIAATTVTGGIFSQQMIFALTLVSAFLGIFFGSWFSLRRQKGRRWTLGIAIGFIVFVLLFVIGLIFAFAPKGNQLPQIMFIALGSGCLGGLPGMKRTVRHKRHR